MIGVAEITDDLAVAAAEGAPGAVAQLLEALRPQVRRMVMVRLRPTAAQSRALDDLADQALLALAAGLGRLERCTVAGVKAFLSGIVTHKVADFITADGKAKHGEPAIRSLDSAVTGSSGGELLCDFLSASATSPLSAVDRAEQISRLMSGFARLKDTHQQVITLAFFDQLPVAEIGQQMGLTPAAASMLLIRAVRTLRQNMARPDSPSENHGRAN